MKVTVNVTESFKRGAKPPLKKYPSIGKDLVNLEKELIINPKLGTNLGNNCFKIRLKIASKGKGMSVGARIISLVETDVMGAVEYRGKETIVNLIYIYDKSELETISNKELKDLVVEFFNDKKE